jgi:hypothetical protein
VLQLKQDLITAEGELLSACRRVEVPLDELYCHALR